MLHSCRVRILCRIPPLPSSRAWGTTVYFVLFPRVPLYADSPSTLVRCTLDRSVRGSRVHSRPRDALTRLVTGRDGDAGGFS